MNKQKPTKAQLYVCQVCGKKQKSSKRLKCCSKDMLARERGSWNM